METIAILDLETTGFSPAKDCIVEIGVVELNLQTGQARIIYDELVREDAFSAKHADAWIFKNSDLKFADVMAAKPLNRTVLQCILNCYSATAFNNKFDFEFLTARGFVFDPLPCPMQLSTNLCKLPKKRGSGYKWPSVEEAWQFFFNDHSYIEKHRGADDALHEAFIVHELYKRGVFVVTPQTLNME